LPQAWLGVSSWRAGSTEVFGVAFLLTLYVLLLPLAMIWFEQIIGGLRRS
jgi:hypothetical protein